MHGYMGVLDAKRKTIKQIGKQWRQKLDEAKGHQQFYYRDNVVRTYSRSIALGIFMKLITSHIFDRPSLNATIWLYSKSGF